VLAVTKIKIMQETLLFFSSPFLFFLGLKTAPFALFVPSREFPQNLVQKMGFKSLIRTFQGQEIES
jgi:hypothetical protein